MRIGHYAPKIWARGGTATYIRRLGDAQCKRGDSVFYYTEEHEGTLPERTHLTTGGSDLLETASKHALDILHLHKPLFPVPDVAPLPLVRTVHGNEASCPSGSRYLARSGTPCNRTPGIAACTHGHLLERCGSVRPHRVAHSLHRFRAEIESTHSITTLPVSHFLKDRMVEAGCFGPNLKVIPSPAPDVDQSPEPMDTEGVPRFLYVGRLAPQKGIFWLLRAFKMLEVPVHLDIAGDGDLMSDAAAFAKMHGMENQVTFHGWVDESRVTTLIGKSRAVVFPSLWHEPAGLVSLEAAAHGRALIASRVGGIPEYALEEYSLLVEPNHTKQLALAMMDLANNPAHALKLGDRGRKVAADTFSMHSFTDAVYRTYDAVAGKYYSRSMDTAY